MSQWNPTRRDVLRGATAVVGLVPLMAPAIVDASPPAAEQVDNEGHERRVVLVRRAGHCRGGWTMVEEGALV